MLKELYIYIYIYINSAMINSNNKMSQEKYSKFQPQSKKKQNKTFYAFQLTLVFSNCK